MNRYKAPLIAKHEEILGLSRHREDIWIVGSNALIETVQFASDRAFAVRTRESKSLMRGRRSQTHRLRRVGDLLLLFGGAVRFVERDHGWVLEATHHIGGFPGGLRRRSRPATEDPSLIRIGLALGGGFARGIAHAGVLKILEQHHIPIHCITGVSAGSIVAAAYASGATPEEIARAGCSMRFGDVGRWSLGRLGLVGSERMNRFLERLLKTYRFEEMRIPLGVVATDLSTGKTVPFTGTGKVFDPIRASCSYPGLFQPVRRHGQLLVDGAMSVEVPAALARQLGATHVISVHLPTQGHGATPSNVFQVVNRCFQILQSRSEDNWRIETDLLIAPDVRGVDWDAFGRGPQLIKAGEAAALAALPKIQDWFPRVQPAAVPGELLPAEI